TSKEEDALTEPAKLSLQDIREIVKDGDELAKGARIFDDGGLAHLSRFEHKLFADAKGSGASPYKVQILFETPAVKGRCSCMAARSRPFCKHSVALLVAWSRAPESFAEAAAPPVPAGASEVKKKEVKKGKVEAKDLMGHGVGQVSTLVRELAVAGVASLAADRVDQVRALGTALRESRLRRLSARTLELADHLARAASRTHAFDASAYAELLGDMLLTARKLEKHIAGEALAQEHVEELIGKTWTKKDRQPVAGLELVEYAFVTRWTSDEFVIRESRFVDLNGGEHYSEKQILPGFLAKRTAPKPSWSGKRLHGASGSLYPTFSPRRLELEDPGAVSPLDSATVARLVERALPTVSAALAALQERRKDVFAPEALPVALRADTLLADGARLQVVDEANAALFLPDEGEAAEMLASVLRGARLAALIGDVALDGALPTLFPTAAVLAGADGELFLASLGRNDASAILETKKVRTQASHDDRGRTAKWVDVARQAGASGAAVALGEVREEMAEALANGLATVVPRFATPLATRLRELSLVKQADLLDAIAARPDPAEKLDDFVKLHQVLGIALARLAGASHVDRETIEPVPAYASVHVRKSERPLAPHEVATLQGSGRLNRYEAAVHYARYYDAVPAEELATSIYPTWADGSAMPYVAAALARVPEAAVDAARRVLEPQNVPRSQSPWWWTQRSTARVAKLTAIRVLESVATPEARDLLKRFVGANQKSDAALVAHASRAIEQIPEAKPEARFAQLASRLFSRAKPKQPGEEGRARKIEELSFGALNASTKESRIAALQQIADGAYVEAIPVLRASFAGDVSADVRKCAADTLARLGDVDSTGTFVRILRDRAHDPEQAKTAARALGSLGDVRGLDELLRAWVEGWHPGVVAEAIRAIGPAALDPIVTLLEQSPDLADRKAALSVIAALPSNDVSSLLIARLDECPAPDFCKRAGLYVKLAGEHPEAAKIVVTHIATLRPAVRDAKTASGEEKALAKKCAKFL
ncbi:MAG TPA: HEAT repeat domain-containing protein, partial [Thermoanaerobaculia bacterium]|nr:HEAT repeat domain-containing protein [Thermoanaerobaculia bacterium]